jgi:surface antigen
MVSRYILGVLALGAAFSSHTAEARSFWQCVPYARLMSGVEIRGNAHTWWGQAAGKYERGREPRVGAVMSMRPHGGSRLGHVAVVSRIVSDREVLLDHANWSRRGRIERGVRAVDVSANGDWSRVKIWFASLRDLGKTSYPVNGFIYSNKASGPVMMAVKQPTQPAANPEKPVLVAFTGNISGQASGFASSRYAAKKSPEPSRKPNLDDDILKSAKKEIKAED